MSLPVQIQKQIEATAQLEAQMAQPSADQPTQPVEPAADQPAPEITFQPPADEPAQQSDDAAWEHKYKVLQGKYNKEVPRLTQQLRDQEQAIQLLQQQMAQLAQPRMDGLDFTSAASNVQISEEEREEYGDDLLDLVGRRALQASLPEIARLEAMIQSLQQQVGAMSGQFVGLTHEKFIEALDKQHKAWRKLNSDEGFLDWLEQVDPFSGSPRKHLLQDAVAARNVERALAFFQGYEAEHGLSPEPRRPAARRQETSLEAMAAPGRGRSGGTPAPASEPQTFSRSQIAAFYSDVRRGAYRGKEAEMARIEQAIVNAASSGRVLPG